RELVLALMPRVRNLVRFLSRGDQDTDDIAQDALVAVVRDLSGYRGEGRFEAWVDRVVSRVTIAAGRVRRSRHARSDASVPDLDVVPDPSALPDEYAARRRAVAMLDALPDAQREAFVLHHVLGMSIAEVATEVASPAETVRSRIRLARARLHDL